jgi:YVTN family beta-propeller protein
MSATSRGLRLAQMLRMGGILGILLLVVLPTPGLLAVPSEPNGQPTSSVSSAHRLSNVHGLMPGKPSHPGALPVDLVPPGTQVLPKPGSSVPPATVLSTLNLLNGTLQSGNVVPENGSYPQNSAIDTDNGNLFVATGGGAIAVIDTASERLIDSIPTGSAVADVAYDSRNGAVYATQYGVGTVTVINGSTDQVITTLKVGSKPTGVTFDPLNGRVYVVNRGSNNVSVIDGSTERVIGSIGVGGAPTYAAVDTKNGRLFVTNYYSYTVTIIDGSTDTVVGTASVGLYPGGVAFDAANGDIYVVDSGLWLPSAPYGDVTVLDGSGSWVATIHQIGTCPWGIAYDGSNHDLYVTDTSCVPIFGNVTVLNGSNNQILGQIPVWGYPNTITYNPLNGNLYTANVYASPNGNLSVINGSTQEVVGTTGTGNAPSAIEFDPNNGMIYVADWGNNEVMVVNSSSNERIGAIAVGFGPRGLALDVLGGRLYVADFASNDVREVDTATDRVTALAPVGSGPIALAYDPSNHRVYVVNFNSNNITVLNGSTLAQIGSIPVGQRPAGILFVPEVSRLLVTDSGPYSQGTGSVDNVTVIDAVTDRAIASIPVGAIPWGLAYDGRDDRIYVPTFASGNMTVINATSDRIVATILVTGNKVDPLSTNNLGVTYDPGNDELFVTYSDSVLVIRCRINTILGGVFTGEFALPALAAPSLDRVYVGNAYSGTLSILQPTVYPPPKFNVTFFETGLPRGAYWTVTLNGTWLGSTTSMMNFTEVNGPYRFDITPVAGYTVDPSSGSVEVNNTNLTVDVVFSPILYSVAFEESGLPASTNWSVTWNGTRFSSASASLTLRSPNGTYPFTIGTPLGWEATPSDGTSVVDGSNLTVSVQFVFPLPSAPVILLFQASAPSIAVNSSVMWTVEAEGSGPLTYSYGGLPPGCRSENLSTWSCTPTRPGEFTVTVVATDVWGRSATSSALLEVTSIGPKTPTVPPNDASFWGLPIWVAGVLVASAVIVATLATVTSYRRGRRERARGSVRGGSSRL